jgi:hypothetical protein
MIYATNMQNIISNFFIFLAHKNEKCVDQSMYCVAHNTKHFAQKKFGTYKYDLNFFNKELTGTREPKTLSKFSCPLLR